MYTSYIYIYIYDVYIMYIYIYNTYTNIYIYIIDSKRGHYTYTTRDRKECHTCKKTKRGTISKRGTEKSALRAKRQRKNA